jgi:uncharacterized protein
VTSPADDIEVVDLPDENRFVVRQDGTEAELVYERAGNRLTLVHTGVPDSLGGRGIGGRLVAAAVARARAEDLTLVPWCPFARRWMRDHGDTLGGVTVDWDTPPPS